MGALDQHGLEHFLELFCDSTQSVKSFLLSVTVKSHKAAASISLITVRSHQSPAYSQYFKEKP